MYLSIKAYFMIIKSAMEFLDDKDICPWNEEKLKSSATENNITHLIQPIIEFELLNISVNLRNVCCYPIFITFIQS